MNPSKATFYRLFTDHYRLRMVVFLLFAFCILAISLTFFTLSLGRPYMGITLSMSAQGWTVERVDLNSVASQAGINEGDKPVKINDQSADTFLEKYTKSGMIIEGIIKEITVVNSDGQLKSVALEDSALSWGGMIEQVARLLVSLVFWIVGFYVLLKRPGSLASSLLCLIGLLVGLMLSGNMAWMAGMAIGVYFEVLATTIGPWLFFHFFLILPEERIWLRNSPFVYVIYLPVAITLILFSLIGLNNTQPVLWFQNIRYLVIGIGLLAAAGVAVFNFFGAASVRTRQQMIIVAVSYCAALIPFLILSLFPTAIWRQSLLPPEFSILFLSFIPVGMGYAIITRKLMDIDVIIRRGIIYGLITLMMASIVSVAIFFGLTIHESLGIPEQIFIALALGGVAAVLFGPGKKGIEFLVDKFFYKDRYDYRQIIQSLGISINTLTDINDVSRLVVGTTVNTLNLAGGCLFTKTQSNTLNIAISQGIYTEKNKQNELLKLVSQRNHAIEFPNKALKTELDLAYIIPLIEADKEVGFLCLSEKISRQDFSSNDVFLLQGISSVAAIGLYGAMLLSAVNLRDTFISVASHELRTPLTSIVGYADLLLHRNPPDEKKKQWLETILDNGQRLSEMVDSLLNVSRIQSGKFTVKLEHVNLTDILSEVVFQAKELTGKHEFVINLEPDVPIVLIDRNKFGQVMANLLSNAIKYSPEGGRIILSVHYEPEKHQTTVGVTDEGIGISLSDQESLFNTFQRIQRPETQGIRGSGLGLYIAKEWMEAMGGKIWLESELNKGSTFFISIPTLQYINAMDYRYTHSR